MSTPDALPLFANNNRKTLSLTNSSQISEDDLDWLVNLYSITDWRSIIIDKRIEPIYNDIPTTSYIKAFALPYLINMPPSERRLGHLIIQNKKLQKLCGFRIGDPMKQDETNMDAEESMLGDRTFWHFRNKYKEIYSEIMAKVLISLVLSGEEPNFDLPFVEKILEENYKRTNNIAEWKINKYRPVIELALPDNDSDISFEEWKKKFDEFEESWDERLKNCNDYSEYIKLKNDRDEELRHFAQMPPKGFAEEITFPIDVTTELISGEKLFFRLDNPDWLNSSTKSPALNNKGAKPSKAKYDKACNILVIRENNGNKEILLTQRLTDGVGEGSFAIPGGKQRDDETIEECAKRELEEETGLVILKSKPVSMYYTRKKFVDNKQIASVGVLVESWTGTPETKEPKKHRGWEWYQLDQLPTPLFEFTRIAISQYIEGKYQNLTWADVEEKTDSETQLTIFDIYTPPE